jgi:Cadherin domain/Putative Ig domain/Dockerin type I domain
LELWQATFMLIQTNTQPNLNDDIDVDSNGLMDSTGIPANWNILDSITVMNSLSDGHAYGKIAFVSTNTVHFPQVTAKPETTIVRPNGWGYVGRLGNSVGSAASDWVGGVVKDLNGDEYFIRLAGDVHGIPLPIYMHGRELDHVGSENFSASAHLQMFQDLNDNGTRDVGENPLAGVKVHVELDGNAERDLIETIIEPDNFASDRQLNNLTPGVTLSTAVDGNEIVGFDIQSEIDTLFSTGSRVFAHSGIPFFNSSRRFRADFYRPARSVSIDVIGDRDSVPTYGRLEAFDAAGNSLQMQRTGPLRFHQAQRLSINTPTDNIAYVVAYPEETFQNSSAFGRLDNFAFTIPEGVATSNSDGYIAFNYLIPGTYSARSELVSQGDYIMTIPNFSVSGNGGFLGKVPAILNEAPVFENASLTIPESATAESSAGNVVATDRVDQSVTYSIVGTSPQFSINSESGRIQLKSGVTLDFETTKSYVIRVRATDNAPKPLSIERDFTVAVTDVNEAPSLADRQFTIAENPTLGNTIGTVTGSDVDAGVNGVVKYRIVDPIPENPVAVDEVTGQLSVLNPLYYDFDTRDKFTVKVEAFDGGDPSLTKRATITVRMTNVNEPHQIATEELSIGELAVFGDSAGNVQVTDPDANETYHFGWAENFVTDKFQIDPSTGEISLKDNVNLSFLREPQHTVRVTVLDKVLPPFVSTREITIKVLDENNPPVIDSVNLTIPENSAAETLVGTVSATDDDVGQTIAFSLIGGNSMFTIEEETGNVRLKAGAVVNFEAQLAHEIVVLATDSGTPSKNSKSTLTVSVQDVNEPPSVVSANFNASESIASGELIGKVVFGDPDSGNAPMIEITPASNLFTINSIGEIRLATGAQLDFETTTLHELTVRVSDGVNSPVSAQVKIAVLNANDAPQANGSLSPITVMAGNALSYVIPLNAAIDSDVGQTLTYTVNGLPSWIVYNSATRKLTGNPWNPNVGVVNLTLVATDNGVPFKSVDIPLKVTVEANPFPFHNAARPVDVIPDGIVTPTDAITVINHLNTFGSTLVPIDTTSRSGFMDVTRDNRISATDALIVINDLNSRASGEAFESTNARAVDFALLELWEIERKRSRRAS